MSYEINSSKNERIKRLRRLRDRRQREIEGVFVVEGSRLFERAITAGLEPIEIFSTVSLDGHDVVSVAPAVLDKASYRQTSEGLLAIFSIPPTRPLETLRPGLTLVVENVEKPGNLGAILRTAATAGVTGLITVGSKVDIYNPNALRASTGAVFSVPVAAGSWADVKEWVTVNDIPLVGAVVGDAPSLWDTNFEGDVAIAIGSEEAGLTERAISHLTRLVTIPTRPGTVDSLNASVAAAVILFEVVRQRR